MGRIGRGENKKGEKSARKKKSLVKGEEGEKRAKKRNKN